MRISNRNAGSSRFSNDMRRTQRLAYPCETDQNSHRIKAVASPTRQRDRKSSQNEGAELRDFLRRWENEGGRTANTRYVRSRTAVKHERT
jgi:hypothetical protein